MPLYYQIRVSSFLERAQFQTEPRASASGFVGQDSILQPVFNRPLCVAGNVA
jgi:hypothetical protein